MGFHNISQTSLDLGLTFSSSFEPSNPDNHRRTTKNPSLNLGSFEPSLTLSLSGETYGGPVLVTPPDRLNITKACAEPEFDLVRQDSAASSFISNVSVKREREIGGEEADIERVSSRASDEDDDGTGNARKKLRLNKAQSALLEESFKEHSTLNPKQKQELARELKLRPRQVEVWFQNRRARTKLKQTEVDCEFLKKCCETLTEENRRLQKEVQELKALKISQPLYMQLPAATLTMCPSCERIAADNTAKTPYVITPKPAHLYNPFTNPSAAC